MVFIVIVIVRVGAKVMVVMVLAMALAVGSFGTHESIILSVCVVVVRLEILAVVQALRTLYRDHAIPISTPRLGATSQHRGSSLNGLCNH